MSPKPLGGDRRSGRIEAHHDYLMGLIRRTPTSPAGDPGASDQELRRAFFAFRALALLRPSRRHVQKKTAHATEQQRPDVLKKRLEWFGDSSISTRQASLHRRNGRLDQFGAQRRALPARARLRIGVPHATTRRSRSSPAYAFAGS